MWCGSTMERSILMEMWKDYAATHFGHQEYLEQQDALLSDQPGIIIGVASVIILVSLLNAYMSYMTESFASLGTNQISVNMVNLPSRSVAVDEMYAFYEEMPKVLTI